MLNLKVNFASGNHLHTSFAGSVDEARKYYHRGASFNTGNGEEDRMDTVTSLEVLEKFFRVFDGDSDVLGGMVARNNAAFMHLVAVVPVEGCAKDLDTMEVNQELYAAFQASGTRCVYRVVRVL